MKHVLLILTTSVALAGGAMAQGTDPVPPRTHVESTVRGDARADATVDSSNGAGLDNDHHFEAGAPHLTEIAKLLDLSAQQKVQLNDVIERADAGAAVLIKREHNVAEMLEKTPPEDPRYAQLHAEQAGAQARWQAGRDAMHQEVRAILTPAQQMKFEQLRAEKGSRWQ